MSNFSQWFVRIFLSALLIFTIFAATESFSLGDGIVVNIITFLIILLPFVGILHLISIIPIFKNVSRFKKYLFALVSLIILSVILFFSVVLFMVFSRHRYTSDCAACDKSSYRDECYYECAMANTDFLTCEKIDSIDYKNKCYAWVSVKSNNFLCDKIINGGDEDQTSSNKSICYKNFAIENKDISLCEKIPLSISFHLPRYDCYKQVAITLQDTSLCANIPDTYPVPGYEKDAALIYNLTQLKSDCLILKK